MLRHSLMKSTFVHVTQTKLQKENECMHKIDC